MKYLLSISLLFVATFTQAQSQPQASVVVSSLSQLTGYTGSLIQANWANASRGGRFDLVDTTGLIVDSGTVFPSGKAGKFWKREMLHPEQVDVRWFGAVSDMTPGNVSVARTGTDNTRAFQLAVNYITRRKTNADPIRLVYYLFIHGRYGLKSTVYLPSMIHIRGTGSEASQSVGASMIGDLGGFVGKELFRCLPNRLSTDTSGDRRRFWDGRISGISFLGNYVNDSVTAIKVQDTLHNTPVCLQDRTELTDLTFTRMTGYGIWVTDGAGPGNFSDMKFIYTKHSGIRIDCVRGNALLNIVDAAFSHNGEYAIEIHKHTYNRGVLTLTNLTFEDGKNNPFYPDTQRVQITPIWLDSCTGVVSIHGMNANSTGTDSTFEDTSTSTRNAGNFIRLTGGPTKIPKIDWDGVNLQYRSDYLGAPPLIIEGTNIDYNQKSGDFPARFSNDSVLYTIGTQNRWRGRNPRDLESGIQVINNSPNYDMWENDAGTNRHHTEMGMKGGNLNFNQFDDDSTVKTPMATFNTAGSVFKMFWQPQVENITPYFALNETDQTTDEKVWVMRSTASRFQLGTMTDAYGSLSSGIEMTRSGNTVTGIYNLSKTLYVGSGLAIPVQTGFSPSSVGLTFFRFGNTTNGTVTSLGTGAKGQIMYIMFDGHTTIAHSALGQSGRFSLVSQQNFLPDSNQVMLFMRGDSTWREVGGASLKPLVGINTNALTFNSSGSGDVSGSTYNGSAAKTLSYNSIGAQSALSGTGYLKFSGTTPSYLTPTQVTADLNVFTPSLQGLVPSGGVGKAKVLHGDGNWYDTSSAGTLSFFDAGEQTYAGTFSNFSGTTAPVTPTGTYRWTRIGNSVTVYFWIKWGTAGTAITGADFTLPSDLPLPSENTTLVTTPSIQYTGTSNFTTGTGQNVVNTGKTLLMKTGTGTYKFTITTGSANVQSYAGQLNYICVPSAP